MLSARSLASCSASMSPQPVPGSPTSGSTNGRRPTCCPTSREQRASTGHVPDDRTIVVERFRDELGDWRVVVHSPFGAQVHAPWGLAMQARMRERSGMDVQVMHTDDGIVLRLPDTDDAPAPELTVFDPDEVEAIVTSELGGSSLFASRFRECAARALLLPRRNPGRRAPLWQQRQRVRPAAQRGRTVRLVPDHSRDDARMPAGRLRCPRAGQLSCETSPTAASA